MTHFLRIGMLIIVGGLPLSLRAQQLNATDTVEIQQKALRYVQQFEGLLNVVSQSDEYFRKYSFDELIRNYYSEESNSRIFRDSLAVIEDDLNPKAGAQDYGNLLTIKDYLKTFFSLYEKSPPPGVIFSDYKISEVKQGEFVFVEVFYTSEFRNKHRAYPDLSYPRRQKRATVKAEPQGQGWQVAITDISYARDAEQSSPPATITDVPTMPPVTTRQPSTDSDTTGAEQTERSPVFDDAIAPPSRDTGLGEASGATRNLFGNLHNVYRKGKTYQLPVQVNPEASPTSLMLYRGTELVSDLSSMLLDSGVAWQVPREISSGSNYQLRLYDPVSEQVIESSTFAIKPKVRWPWVVGAVGAAAAVYIIVSNGEEGGVATTERDDELPAPPSPE